MTSFVFDANVPWDLDKINELDKTIQVLDNNLKFRIYISYMNFIEMPISVRNKLRQYQHVIIDEPNEEEFKEFREEIRQRRIILNEKDSAVLYTSNKVDADYIVSSDTMVRLKAKEYAESYGKKARSFHLLDMLSFLHEVKLIESNLCIKMALSLYKKKEIPYMVAKHGAELISNIIQRETWIRKETKESVDTFNNYQQHVLIQLR